MFGGIGKVVAAATKAAIAAQQGGPSIGQSNTAADNSNIPHAQSAAYPSLQEFMSFSLKNKDYTPASTNLFSIHIVTPALLRMWRDNSILEPWSLGHIISDTIGYRSPAFVSDNKNSNLHRCLNFYCQSISTPSKQLTTGSLVNIGTATKYATGSAFSQITATFIAPKSMHSRNFFERWMHLMAPDSNQYSDYYDYYNAPRMMIFKWEKGGGHNTDQTNRNATQRNENFMDNQVGLRRQKLKAHDYRLTASWELQHAFPYNIGSTQMNNAANRPFTFTVGFFFERYRFYTEPEFDDPGVRTQISIPGLGNRADDYYDPLTDAQQIFWAVDRTQASIGEW